MNPKTNKKTTTKKIIFTSNLFWIFLVCFVLNFIFKIPSASATVTYFGSASTPSDNGTNTANPTAVTPPSSMQEGDLVIMIGSISSLTWNPDDANFVVSQAGGQSWTSLSKQAYSVLKTKIFWCRYNGSWSANPSVSFGSASSANTVVVMHVFRPTGTNYNWAVDVAESSGTFSAPSSPYTVTISGITTNTNGALVFANWADIDDNTWGSLTSGWSTPGSDQYRNTSGLYDQAVTSAYLVKTTAGSTGNVSKNENGANGGTKYIIAFKEVMNTTTLGDGTDPSNSTIGPGDSATEIDRFSLATDYGTDTVSALTVTLGPTGAYNNIASVDVQTTGGTSKCSSSSISSNTVSLSSCGISVTTSSTQYKIMITPKTHANMPAVPGASYATTATITSVTGSNTQSGTDTDSATITVDNASPEAYAELEVNGTDAYFSFESVYSFIDRIIVLKRTGSAVTDVPTEGADYSIGNTIGSSTVVCANSGSPPSDSCTYASYSSSDYYKIFYRDDQGNYSEGEDPAPAKVIVGDGTDPSNSTIGPGSSAIEIDRFTLRIGYGTGTVSSLTIELGPSGSYENIATVDVQTTGGVSKCSTNNVNDIHKTLYPCNISVNETPVEYKILITPKTHANMPAVPGDSYDTTLIVMNYESWGDDDPAYRGADSDSAAITVDNASPGEVVSGNVIEYDTECYIGCTLPTDSDFTTGGTVLLLRRTGSAVTDVPVEGATYSVGNTIGSSTVACVDSGSPPDNACWDSGLSNGTDYYYKVFTMDSRGNYSAGMSNNLYGSSPATPSAGTLAFGIMDGSGQPVDSPYVNFSSGNFSWNSQQSTGTLGVTDQKIAVYNNRVTRNWTLTIAATSGNTARWTSSGNSYDFNDSAANGRLQIDPSSSSLFAGCSTTGISKGSATYFVQGSADSITLFSADSSAAKYCFWVYTGVSLTQDIPAGQQGGSYSISMTLTAS